MSKTPSPPPPTLAMFTDGDLDGAGCAVVFKVRFGADASVTHCSPRNSAKRIAEYLDAMQEANSVGSLFIADISIKPETATQLDAYIARGGTVTVLDHHLNGPTDTDGRPYWEWMAAKPWATLDLTRCGAKLTYDLLQPGQALEAFVDLVQDYDLSGWQAGEDGVVAGPSPAALSLSRLRSLVRNPVFVARFTADPAVGLRLDEQLLIDLDQQAMDNYYIGIRKNAMVLPANAAGQVLAVALAERYKTEVAHKLLEDTSSDAVLLIDLHHRSAALRSRPGVNVGRPAAILGGGGHDQASGINADNSPVLASLLAAVDDALKGFGATVATLVAEAQSPQAAIAVEAEQPGL